MPFISGYSPEGRTFGELARRELPCSNERRQLNSINIAVFDINSFVSVLRADILKKKEKYEVVNNTPIIGGIRALFTRYEEKKDFILKNIIPVIKKCCSEAKVENIHALAETFKAGAVKFTTDGKFSGLAKICEDAYFALTDPEKINSANFTLLVTQKSEKNTVDGVSVKNTGIPVLGTVVPETTSHFRLFKRHNTIKPVVATVDICAELGKLAVPMHRITVVPVRDNGEDTEKCCVSL